MWQRKKNDGLRLCVDSKTQFNDKGKNEDTQIPTWRQSSTKFFLEKVFLVNAAKFFLEKMIFQTLTSIMKFVNAQKQGAQLTLNSG